jgi:HlyD family secretion protein
MNIRTVAAWGTAGLALFIGTSFLVAPTEIGKSTADTTEHAAPLAPPDIVALGEVLPVSNIITVAGPTGQDGGRIVEIAVSEGDLVERGTVLATLDTLPVFDAQLQQAIASLERSKADLAQAEADSLSNEHSLEAELEQQGAERDLAQWSLEQATVLKEKGHYEEAYLTDKRIRVASADARLKNTQVLLDRARERNATGLPLSVAIASANVKAAEAAVIKARADLDKALIRAPIAGRILTLNGRPGQEISSSGFAEIADTTTMLVRAEVFETDVHFLRVGAPCTVRSRVLPNALSGTVSRIAIRLSEQSVISTEPTAVVDSKVVEVWVRLDDASSRAVANLSGLQVSANFGPGDSSHV